MSAAEKVEFLERIEEMAPEEQKKELSQVALKIYIIYTNIIL